VHSARLNLLGDSAADQVRTAYGAALVCLMAAVVVSITFGASGSWSSLAGGLQGLALLATLQVSGAPRLALAQTVAVILTAGALAAELTSAGHPLVDQLIPAAWALVVLATIVAIGRHLATFNQVDTQTLLGLLSVYVLLGLLFAWIFVLVGRLGFPFFANGVADLGSCVYFSYVNLATIGFGDLTPQPGLPRALAVAEAILGQLYLVAVVSVAVSRLAASPKA